MFRKRFGKGKGTSPLITASAPAGADFPVTNDDEFATANTNATAGQIIELQDSGTFTNLTLTNATGVTVRGQTSQVPVVRSLTINGAQNATVTGLKIQANAAPSANPKLIDLRGNLNGLVIENCYIRGGNPWNSFANFDPTVTDTARMGTNAAWAATNPYKTDLWYGIGTGGSGATAPSGNITIRNNTILDLAAGIKFGVGSSVASSFTINGNVIGRTYEDLISIIIGSSALAISGIEICGNELFDNFSQAQDNANPHGDYIQISVATTWANRLPGVLIAGNIAWFTPGGRSQGQRIFLDGFDTGQPVVAPIVVDNVMLGRLSNKGAYIKSADPEGAGWAYIYRNVMLANPRANVLNGNESFTNSVSGIGPASIGTVTNEIAGSPALSNALNFVSYNTAEALQSAATNDAVNNISTTGPATTATAYQTWFDTDTNAEWDAVTSADATITALTHKVAYVDYRPMVAGETAAQFRARWATPGSRPWSSLPSWVNWADLTNVTTSSVQTSSWSFVHAGGPGSSRSITISGGEYRIADDTAGTNATAWTSSAGMVAHGKYLQVRQTASSSGATGTTLTGTIGSTAFDWTVTTASSFARPVVTLEPTTPDLFRISGASNLGSDGNLGTAVVWGFKMAAAPSAETFIFGQSGGSGRVQVSIITTGRLRVRLRNAAGTQIAAFDTAVSICDGASHDIMISWNTNDTTAATGINLYLDGVSSTSGVTWVGSPTNVSYSSNVTSYQVGNSAGGQSMNIAGFFLHTTARADFTSSSVRAAFTLDPAVMGVNGATPLGTQPIHFLVGTAGQTGGWNDAAGINRGSGAKFIKVGSTAATDVSGSAWV